MVLAVTLDVVMLNVADFCPSGIVMEAGTTTLAWSLANVTTVPPLGATPPDGLDVARFAVAVTVAPPFTVAGFNPSETLKGDHTVTHVIAVAP